MKTTSSFKVKTDMPLDSRAFNLDIKGVPDISTMTTNGIWGESDFAVRRFDKNGSEVINDEVYKIVSSGYATNLINGEYVEVYSKKKVRVKEFYCYCRSLGYGDNFHALTLVEIFTSDDGKLWFSQGEHRLGLGSYSATTYTLKINMRPTNFIKILSKSGVGSNSGYINVIRPIFTTEHLYKGLTTFIEDENTEYWTTDGETFSNKLLNINGSSTTFAITDTTTDIENYEPYIQPEISSNGTFGVTNFSVRASSEPSSSAGGYSAWRAFNKTMAAWSDCWAGTNDGDTLDVYLQEPISVKGLWIRNRAAGEAYGVQQFNIYGSNDSITWEPLTSEPFSNPIPDVNLGLFYIPLQNTESYNYYRLEALGYYTGFGCGAVAYVQLCVNDFAPYLVNNGQWGIDDFSIRASGYINTQYQPYEAFDKLNSESTYEAWASANATDQWIEVYYKNPTKVDYFILENFMFSDSYGVMLKGVVEVSDDGENFTTLVEFTNSTVARSSRWSIEVLSGKAYKHYRIKSVETTGWSGSPLIVVIGEIYIISASTALGNYETDIGNKPKINSIELIGNKTSSEVGILEYNENRPVVQQLIEKENVLTVSEGLSLVDSEIKLLSPNFDNVIPFSVAFAENTNGRYDYIDLSVNNDLLLSVNKPFGYKDYRGNLHTISSLSSSVPLKDYTQTPITENGVMGISDFAVTATTPYSNHVNYQPWYIFDGDETATRFYYTRDAAAFVKVFVKKPILTTKIQIVQLNTNYNAPSCEVSFSKDDVTYTEPQEFINPLPSQTGVWELEVNNTDLYNYINIQFNNTSYLFVYEIRLIAKDINGEFIAVGVDESSSYKLFTCDFSIDAPNLEDLVEGNVNYNKETKEAVIIENRLPVPFLGAIIGKVSPNISYEPNTLLGYNEIVYQRDFSDFRKMNYSKAESYTIPEAENTAIVIPAMTTNGVWSVDEFSVRASSEYDSNYLLKNCFDSISTNFWTSAAGSISADTPATLDFNFKNPVSLHRILLTNRNNNTVYSFASGKVYGSDDGENFQLISSFVNSDNVKNSLWSIDFEKSTFPIFRISIESTFNSPAYASMGNIYFNDLITNISYKDTIKRSGYIQGYISSTTEHYFKINGFTVAKGGANESISVNYQVKFGDVVETDASTQNLYFIPV